MRRGFGRRQVPLPGRPPGMAATGPDLYESLQIRYPPSPTRASAPASPPAASRWPLGTILAVGVGVVLVLGAALATLITLHVQGQAELQAARAELAAVRTPLLPDPDGPRSPHESPAAAQRRRDQLASAPSPRLPAPQGSGCRGCPWAGGTTGGRSTSSRGSRSPGARRRLPAAPRTPTSPPSPAPRSRTTWRGRREEDPTGSGWWPRAAPGAGWTGLPTPRPRVSGRRGSRTTRTTGSGARRAAPRSTRWATASGTTITATSPSSGSARGT
ncbi:translation initiation factor IF-2-like isoform X1 [Grus americana]|uniref:translation initiation factor IF-2-like isoform X1 n=1 Tax=Grus americana TaxID=9117 RepID=UPI00240887FD|nr:translation initiation factor IF-2-like isoform X1 [Grus americana]